MHPVARMEGVLATELPGGEIVLYDGQGPKYQQLSPTCACVWKHSDGSTSVERIASIVEETFGLEEAGDIVEFALDELNEKNLLVSTKADADPESPSSAAVSADVSRRDALHRLAARGVATALLPVVTSLILPDRAEGQAISPVPFKLTSISGFTPTFSWSS